jgi:adenylate kinase family enzyme
VNAPSAEEFRPIIEAALELDGWVVDGNYRTRLGTLVLEKADLVVWLDLPRRTKFWRIFRRTLRRVRGGRCCGGRTSTRGAAPP